MEGFLHAESVMVVLFITVGLGYLARKVKLVDDAFDSTLSKVVINITCPAVVLDSVLANTSLPDNIVMLQILGASVVIFIPVFALSFALPCLYRIPRMQRGGHTFTIAFSNVGFVGFAVCSAILGPESVLYVAVYNIIVSLFIYSIGAWMISRSGTIELTMREQLTYVRKNLISPIMGASVLALILALMHVTDSGIIEQTCNLVGGMTAPAAMLVIGSTLAKYRVRTMLSNPWAYITTAVRLIVVPAITYLVGGVFISDPYQLASIVLAAAMPAAMVGSVMSIVYGGDLESLSQCMFLSIVFCLVTIPLVAGVII